MEVYGLRKQILREESNVMPTNNTNNNTNNQQDQSAPKKSLPTGDIIGKRRGVFELDKKKTKKS